MAKRRKKKQQKGRALIIRGLFLLLMAGLILFLWARVKYAVKGVDVSHYQEEIDWETVAQNGISFAFIKATEGKELKDEYFRRNWDAAGAAGIARGAYHFFLPSVDVEAQVDNFLSVVQVAPGDLPPVLDLEVTGDQDRNTIRAGARRWLELVEQRTGVTPILYTMPRFAEDYLDESFGKYPLWMARLHWFWWGPPAFWSDWTFWQYSHNGTAAGISGEVDLNYFNGTPEHLERFLVK